MKENSTTKEELIREIAALKKKINALEQSRTGSVERENGRAECIMEFRSLLEATSDWIWEINSDGLYTYASPRVKDLLGYEPEEIIGKSPLDFMPDKERNRINIFIEEIKSLHYPFSELENINLHKDGQEVFIETNGVPIFGLQGEFLGYCGFDRDVTERKRSTEALSISQLRLEEAMQLANIVYWEFDTITQQYVFDNAFYSVYGTTAEREGGYRMTIEEYAKRFIHPEDLQSFFQSIEQNISRKDTEFIINFEHRIIRPGGDVRHILARTQVIQDNSGQPTRLYGANQDITERKLADQERERLILELREAISQVKTLSGLLPICSSCKKIRNDQGEWEAMESYIQKHSEANFSHGLCHGCGQRLYPDFYPKK